VGFTVNLSSVFLKLAEPITNDPEKLKKLDWQFLSAKDAQSGAHIFPSDSTLLTSPTVFASLSTSANIGTSSSSDVSGSGGNVSESGTKSASAVSNGTVGEFNFITQSFFLCWRALHLGLVQQYTKYQGILRALAHHQGGLETNDPQSVQYMVWKLTTDVLLLNSNTLRYVNQLVRSWKNIHH
jgi:hypothetical protein